MVITFCKNKCCPVIEIKGDGYIQLGDANGPEGVTRWTEKNFTDFVEAAKEGKFDGIILKENPSIALCPCGLKPAGNCDCIDLDDARDCECGKMSIRYCKPDTCIKDR